MARFTCWGLGVSVEGEDAVVVATVVAARGGDVGVAFLPECADDEVPAGGGGTWSWRPEGILDPPRRPALAEDRRGAWSATIDANRAVITRIGRLHADDARAADHASGPATEKSINPGDVLPLFEYADVQPDCTVLLASASCGDECALLSRLLGGPSATALDDSPPSCRGTLVARKCPDGTAGGHAQLWTEPPAGPFAWFGDPRVVPVTVHPGGTFTPRVDDTDD